MGSSWEYNNNNIAVRGVVVFWEEKENNRSKKEENNFPVVVHSWRSHMCESGLRIRKISLSKLLDTMSPDEVKFFLLSQTKTQGRHSLLRLGNGGIEGQGSLKKLKNGLKNAL